MLSALIPSYDRQRIEALRAYGVLDTAPETDFDDIVRLVASICVVPIAAVTLVDEQRQWFMARVGLAVCQTGRDVAFCAHTVLDPGQLFVVPDAALDPRFADNPLVTGEPYIRFYAGAPLVDKNGFVLGSLCVIDTVPRTLDSRQLDALATLGRLVVRQLESRKLVVELAEQKAALDRHSIVAIADVNGAFTYVNDRFCALLQHSRETLLGPTEVSPGISKPGREVFTPSWEKVCRGEVWSGEVEGRTPNGSNYCLQVTVVPMKNAAGAPWQFIALGTDIGERKRAEEKLELLSAVVQQSSDSVVITEPCVDRPDAQILYVNPAFSRLMGYSAEEMVGQSLSVFHGPRTDRAAVLEMRQALVNGESLRAETVNYRKDGSTVDLEWQVSPVRNRRGVITHGVALQRDITVRKTSEEKFCAATKEILNLKTALDEHALVAITSAQGKITYVNDKFCAISQFARAELVGQDHRIVNSGYHSKEFLRDLWTTIGRGKVWKGEIRNKAKDGSHYWVATTIVPFLDDRGKPRQYVTIRTDVTERKLAEIQLGRAREAALESSRLKSRFLANMSHELRTPLNTINGLSATLAEQDLPPRAKQSVELILQCGETLLENIQTILTHSTLEAGKATLEHKPFSISDVIMNALRITEPAAQKKKLDLSYSLDPSTPEVLLGDPFRVQQVLVNLLANAIKFTEKGRIFLRMRVRRSADGKWKFSFTVADTGTGIAPDVIGKLFRPFYQGDDSTTRRFEGTGLGLAITKSLVELMGGSIAVKSRPGAGSIFNFTVVLENEPGSRSLLASTAHSELAGKRLSIVEPDPIRIRFLASLARAWGLQVDTSTDPSLPLGSIANHDLEIRSFSQREQPPRGGFGSSVKSQIVPVLWLQPIGFSIPPDETGGPSATLNGLFSAKEFAAALVSLLTATRKSVRREGPSVDKPTVKLGERIPLRILSADDTITNRMVLSVMCEHLGYHTDLVVNGAEVLQCLNSNTYDLILLDVQMPVLDGLSASREICRLYPDKSKRPRIVAVTASVQPGDREKCLAAGMDDYLSKPILPKDLRSCIERLFDGRTLKAAPGAPSLARPAKWIDGEHLKALTDGLTSAEAFELISQLHDTVKSDFKAVRPALGEACALQETDRLIASIHGLKGCVLSIGWTRMGTRCAETLSALRENRFSSWSDLPLEIDELCTVSSAELHRTLLGTFGDQTQGKAEFACGLLQSR